MFYEGNILKTRPHFRKEVRVKTEERFQKIFQAKYADKFELINTLPQKQRDKVQLKCRKCGHITYRNAISILKGTFNMSCDYCKQHKSSKVSPRKKLSRILGQQIKVKHLTRGNERNKQVVLKCTCGYTIAASYSRVINKSIRQQCPKCGRDVYK